MIGSFGSVQSSGGVFFGVVWVSSHCRRPPPPTTFIRALYVIYLYRHSFVFLPSPHGTAHASSRVVITRTFVFETKSRIAAMCTRVPRFLRRGGWISAGASSGTLLQLLASQTLGRSDDAVMVTLLGLSVAATGVMCALWTFVVGWRNAFVPLTFPLSSSSSSSSSS